MQTWQPTPHRQHGCVVSVFTASYRSCSSWASVASEILINWGMAHRYSVTLFDETFVYSTPGITHGANLTKLDHAASKSALLWAKPRAMLEVLLRGRSDGAPCPWVLFVDADAFINNPRVTVELRLLHRLRATRNAGTEQSSTTHMLFACHSPYGSGGECSICKCCHPAHCTEAARATLPSSGGSWLNSGVILAAATAEAVEMLQWWARAGD
jgi:hypothetical protein